MTKESKLKAIRCVKPSPWSCWAPFSDQTSGIHKPYSKYYLRTINGEAPEVSLRDSHLDISQVKDEPFLVVDGRGEQDEE